MQILKKVFRRQHFDGRKWSPATTGKLFVEVSCHTSLHHWDNSGKHVLQAPASYQIKLHQPNIRENDNGKQQKMKEQHDGRNSKLREFQKEVQVKVKTTVPGQK